MSYAFRDQKCEHVLGRELGSDPLKEGATLRAKVQSHVKYAPADRPDELHFAIGGWVVVQAAQSAQDRVSG
jgi:hypothetical protein